MLFIFDDFELDSDQLELRRAGAVQKVEPQVFSLLELLVANAHRMVSKEEINERVWGGRVVSEAALSSRIRSARRAVGDDGKAQRRIRTMRDRGFRFVGEVAVSGTAPRPEPLVVAAPRPDAEPGARVDEPPAASIAVLPLTPLTDDPRRAPLADAVSHELITELSRLRWLHVIARASSFRFRGPDLDLAEVGRILGVRYVVSGSLSVFGGESVVTLELARPEDGTALWADRIEVPLQELMALRATLPSRIATSIESRIQSEEAQRVTQLPTENLDSWSSYFRGLWHVYRFNAHDNDIAAHLFGRAIALDPGFARAHAGLSFAHFQNAFVGYKRDRTEEVRSARTHAERGYALDPTDPFINLTMGRAELLGGDWSAASPWFDRTTELNSNYSLAYYHRALSDAVAGDGREAPELAMRAISLSPVDPLHYAMLAARGLAHLNRGELEEACRWSDAAAKSPNAHVLIWTIAGVAHAIADHPSEAGSWAARILERDPKLTRDRFFRSFPFARAELRERMSAALGELGL